VDQARNISLARELLAALQEGRPPEEVAAMFSDDVLFEIPGDDGVLPWIGHRRGRAAVAEFIAATRAMTDLLTFDIEDIAASEARAIIVGELASRIRKTDKVVETAFAIILTISGDRIIRFRMLEDSFAVSLAGRA
jgi:ketosteroid isomerase-like protein